ncbi:hypothetical protein RAZWK3B_16760 [Roseobacter sp. AzwK-3b]|uniref:VRR-NUC domain-containing protein n=1 Tax=Roseobacter sp. AzwK-3b TaxID=351016 RepID=UPI00015699BA|nr:VRR-NUC domain-containing protein [Roseobacter sp. AzwK-3b]EDM70812.1 hypothetical protein RAZWK3B_15483 [Roseobacter sp. AzwK-3b]EDM71067.1 hypothetical protein RAZWK3B_16760 [Roseobacter sp. AzwK-3b]
MNKRIDHESPIQIAIVDYLRSVLPAGCIVHHCRGEINKSGAAFMRELAKAKRKGALPGFPDLIVLPYANIGALFFEVKAEGNYADKNQRDMHEALRALGYRVAVVRSIDDVREALAEWGVGTTERKPDNWASIGDLAKDMIKGAVE